MRKDNELLILANESTCEVFSEIVWLDKDSVRKLYSQPVKPIQGTFKDYLTDIDVSSPCERLPDDYQAFLDSDRPKYVQPGGIDTAAFREWCSAVDKDEKWIMKTEKELF